MKSGVIGETLQASSFKQSGSNFHSVHGADHTHQGNTSGHGSASNSPRGLEGTKMKLSHKSKGDTRSSPFE